MSQSVKSVVVVVSDRVTRGEREDTMTPVATQALQEAGCEVTSTVVVAEESAEIREALAAALEAGAELIVTCGGTGVGPRNTTPEVSEEFVTTRLPGLETQVTLRGVQSTPQAGLSRGIIGVTERSPRGAIIANAPSSTGGIRDTLAVLLPVVDNIREGLHRES